MAVSADAPSSIDTARQALAKGQFDIALTALGQILAADPDNVDALYVRAVTHRYQRDLANARASLDALLEAAPGYARARQEEGHWFRTSGQNEAALRAYQSASRINPGLIASVKAQVEILLALGRPDEARQAKAQYDYLSGLPKALLAVLDLIGEGRLLKAEDLCRQYLRRAPRHVEAMRLLADIGIRLGVLDDAEFLLESACVFSPDHIPARIDYIGALRKRQKYEAAFSEAKALLARNPEHPQFQSIFAIEAMQTGDTTTAIRAFGQVLDKLPNDPVTLTSRGHALKTAGEFDTAVASYQHAIHSRPTHGEAFYALANLKTYRFSDRETDAMRELIETSRLDDVDRVYVHFALASACESQRRFDEAFKHYAAGNEIKKRESRYDADEMHADLVAQQQVCTAERFAARGATGETAIDPIFILGLPRAGSTLLEQILSSHPDVDGTLELPNILSLSQTLRRRGRAEGASSYPSILWDLTDQELVEFGERFLADTRIHRQGAPRFIDKMPNNFRHVGLIKLILPNAKIIDARRHPMACCFSAFKQLFAEGQEFTYSLDDVGRYYRDYVDLMAHWDDALPGHVLRVTHEDVVDDLEHEVRRLLDFCELPFDERCLRFYETERNIRTPSSEQVRQPIYREATEAWQPFVRWLDPLKTALGPALDGYPQTPDSQRR